MSDSTFTTWGLDESPVTIDYSLVVLEEIRHEVNQGLQKIARGGIEVGGVLYGVCDGRKVKVEAMRPIACSHSQGPAFVLSEEDMTGLEQQMREDLQDPHLDGLVCVGWFVSHNRGEMELTERDNELFTRFFPDSWQLTLLVRPGRGSSTKAAFFVREADGSVKLNKPHKEFDFPDRLAGVLDRVAKRERPADTRKGFRELPPIDAPAAGKNRGPVQQQGGFAYDPGAYGQQYYEGQMPMPQPGRGSGSGKMWMFVTVAAVVVLGAAGAALYYSGIFVPPKPETLGLAMADRNGSLQIEWNPSSSAMLTARRGDLYVVDGGQTQDIPLTVGDLQKGASSYVRKSGDVEVRLSVEGANGNPQTESTHFLGQAPAVAAGPKEEAPVLDDRKAELEAEIEKLKATNASQAERIQQLQRNLTILQTRIGIAQPADPQQ